MTREERETWKPPSVEPGFPPTAPETALAYALALDRVTGGSGSWFLELEEELTE